MADDDQEMPDDDAILDAEDDEETTDPAGEPEEEDEEIDAADAEPPARSEKPSRRDGRVQRLAEEKKRLADEADRLRRELEDTRRRIPQQPVEDPRIEQERLALMSPEDRMQYQLDKALRQNEQRTQQLLFQQQQQLDKQAYDFKAKDDKLYASMAEAVEKEYQRVISQGRYASREDIHTYLVGQRAKEQRGKANPKAAASRKRQEAPPVRGRGDAPRSSGRFDLNTPEGRVAAFEAKYGDKPINSF